MTTQKQSPLVVSSIIGIIGMALSGLWNSAAKVETYIGTLPVKGAQTAAAAPANASGSAGSLAVLYPLYVESKQKAERLPQASAASSKLIDESFTRSSRAPAASGGSPTLPVPQPVALPDYFPLLRQAVHLDAITGNGAVLNGHFYEVGQPVTAFAYPGKKEQKMSAPVLQSVLADEVVLAEAEGEGTRTIRISARPH
jgi:hypothetical protein